MQNRPSIMEHRFSAVPQNPMVRSSFKRNFLHKTTCDAGYIVPVLLQEILPGDTVSLNAMFFGRISTLQYPLMDNVWVDSFAFFVPNRLVWSNWQKFNGERLNPADSIDYVIPYLRGNDPDTYQFQTFGLGDYFGLPVGKTIDPQYTKISALPFRGYWLIRDEWFRDQNLQDSLANWSDGDGPDEVDVYDNLARRGKRHDYFTSCLPWPQNGDEVRIPLGTEAPVAGDGNTLKLTDGTNLFDPSYVNDLGDGYVRLAQGASQVAVGTTPGTGYPSGDLRVGVTTNSAISGLVTDLSNATSASINALREAFATQQYYELLARSGSRYVEQIRNIWGVQVPDFRLQRPEYLGGSSDPIDIRQVAQTAPTSGSDAMASLAGNGQYACKMTLHHSFVEHGYMFVLLNFRADLTYQEGIERHWTREDRFDFYQPPFAHLGEQPVYQREIYYDPADEANPTVFGYQERWAEYRYARSYVSGAFRSDFAQSLDAWHLAIDFGGVAPQLDSSFIEDDPPIDRVRAIVPVAPDNQQFLVDCYFQQTHSRLMPVFSVPGLTRL